MARNGRGPSPRDDARRRRSWHDDEAEAPWLDEGDYEDDEPTHTLIGRRTLIGLLFLAGVLAVGVIVGIGLVSGRESAPIDVPAVGEEVPILTAPGPWKVPPSGPEIDGVPVEGQGQVIYGTGDGVETAAAIDTSALPEDPLPRPGTEAALPAVDEALAAPAPGAVPAPPAPVAVARPEPARPPAPRPATPKVVEAPPAGGAGTTLQLGAFSSQARARAAFKSLTDRYVYLQGLEPLIATAEVDGRTLYRLRTTAPSAAAARDICGRLRVAGEACTTVD